MSFKDICNMPINKIANDNSVLLMWVIDPLLDKQIPNNKGMGIYLQDSLHLHGQRQ